MVKCSDLLNLKVYSQMGKLLKLNTVFVEMKEFQRININAHANIPSYIVHTVYVLQAHLKKKPPCECVLFIYKTLT